MVVSAKLRSAIAWILVCRNRALGGGLQAQLVDVGPKAEGPVDCKSICDPEGSPYDRNVEALQFLKRTWVPDDKNPINLTAVANRRIFFGEGKFSLEYDEEQEVRNLAIKNPPPNGMVVTVLEMSCVLRCFKKLTGLFIDDSGVQGALQDLFLPENLVELHMRDCPISGALTDLGHRSLLGLKLSSSKHQFAITGDLKDLNVDRLAFLDLRGCRRITGNLADLKCSTLRGIFLQYTGVSGDITRLLRDNRRMTWLDLRGTRVHGSINSEWRQVGQDLIHLRLSDTSVTFNMSEPELVQDRSKAPKPFPRLARLDLNGCPLNMDIWDLLLPLLYNEKLFWLEAESCGLRGTIQDMRQYKLFPTYFGFYILDFSGNNITELAGRPKGDCSYDLSRNPLSRISEMYFAWPSSLNIRESGFDSEAEGSIQGPDGPRKWEDVFEISNQSVRAVRNNGEGWECEWVNSRENPFFDLWISPKTFAPRHLCTCLENFEDDGTACRKCPTGVTSIPDGDTSTSRSRCCACPEGKTAVGDSNMCYKCLGPGCTHRVCTGRCPKGYGGALCSYCADKYKRDFGSKVCEKCPRDGRFGGWTYAKYIGICGLWFAGLGGVLWYFVYHKVERFSGNELGQRKQECIEQSLLLLTFFQLLKTVRYAVDTKSAAGAKMSFFGYSFDILRTAVLLRIGDLLKLLDVECDVGHLNGLLIQRLSSALLLPTLCLLALAVGGCRGSPFFALRFCLFVVALLFPGTIEVTLSNLICVTADEEGLPLPEKDRFNQELPWVPCDSPAGFLYALLWIAFVLNAIILPLSILILARYMHREVEPLWLWSRWLKPSNLSSSPDGFTLRWDVPAVALVARSASGPAQGSAEQYTRMLQKSSQIFLAAHAAFLWESMRHPQQLAIRTSFLNAGLPHADAAQQNAMASHSPAADAHPLQQALLAGYTQAMTLVVQCRIPDGWKDSQDAREAALRSVRPEAMALGEMLLYREASKRALKALGAKPLWIGARASFEKFSGTDPLLFVGINKLVFFAIAGLCVNKNLAAVVISFLLLTIGVSRGDPHGTRSRNALGFVCCLFLTVYSCLLLLFEDFALSSISQAAVVAGPTCYYLHLQLMPADLTIEAYSLLARLQGLDPAKEATPESPTIPTVEERTVSMVPRAKWSWEEHRFLRSLFRGYRQRVVPQLAISGQRLMAIETQSLHGVGRMVRLLAGRGTVTQHPPAVELRTRAPG